MSRDELLDRLDRAAAELQIIGLPKVFVGGATIRYVDAASGAVLRETRDVDVMVEAASYAEFSALEADLRAAGFHQAPPTPAGTGVTGLLGAAPRSGVDGVNLAFVAD